MLAGDVIKKVDQLPVRKFADLTGYVNSKRPNDVIDVTVIRKRKELVVPVKLSKYEIQEYNLEDVGVGVVNVSKEYLEQFGLDHGVAISKALSARMQRYNLKGLIISE